MTTYRFYATVFDIYLWWKQMTMTRLLLLMMMIAAGYKFDNTKYHTTTLATKPKICPTATKGMY
jgi:hypothetical protein